MSKPYKKHPSLIVLEALLMGHEVDLAGLDIMMDEEYNLTIPAYDANTGEKLENHRLKIDYGPLGAFIHGCELIDDDTLMLIAADITLNKMNRR